MRNTSLLRRAAALGCAALLTFGLAACGEKEESQTETRLYRDGTYTAQFDTAGADGYTTYAVVEIAGDTWTARPLIEGDTYRTGEKILVHQIEGATAIVVRGV